MDGWNSLYSNPIFNAGLNILAANRPGATFGQAVGQGLLNSQANLSQLQQALEAKKARDLQQQIYQQQLQKMQEDAARAKAQQEARKGLLGGFGQTPEQQQQLGLLANAYPNIAGNLISQQLMPKPEQLPSGMRMGPNGPEWIPGYIAGRQEIAGAGAPQVTATTYLPKQQTEEAKIVGRSYGEDFVNMQKAERSARSENAKLDRLNSLLENTYTGAGGKAIQSAKKAAASLGIDVSGVQGGEAATALANEMALQLRNPSGGAGMPGAMSDKDREFLQSMVPGLTTTPEGRKQMVETRKRINNRSIEVAKMARDYRSKHGSLDENFFSELARYSESHPLFEDMSSQPIMPGTASGWSARKM